MLRTLLAGLLVFAIGPAGAAPLSTLVIKVEKVSPRGGDVRVALYNQQNYSGDQDVVTDKVVPAHPGETIVTIENLKPGIYAAKLFQDFNRNGQFDMNWIGLPIEKYGFSNDASPTFSEPVASMRPKFELHPGTNTITIHLQ